MRTLLKACLWLLALVGIAAIAGGVYVVANGVSARAQPGAIETWLARGVRSLAIGRNARTLQNPVARSTEVMAEGMAHFADHCATCHGNDGSGTTSLGQGLFPKPPDMRRSETQNLADGELFTIIENGVRFTGMPAFGNDSEEGRNASWTLVHFIRHLPNLTEAELEQMAELNPVPPEEVRQRIMEEQFLRGTDPAPPPPSPPPHRHEGGPK